MQGRKERKQVGDEVYTEEREGGREADVVCKKKKKRRGGEGMVVEVGSKGDGKEEGKGRIRYAQRGVGRGVEGEGREGG